MIFKAQSVNIQKCPLNSDIGGGNVSCSEQPAAHTCAHTLPTSAQVSISQNSDKRDDVIDEVGFVVLLFLC